MACHVVPIFTKLIDANFGGQPGVQEGELPLQNLGSFSEGQCLGKLVRCAFVVKDIWYGISIFAEDCFHVSRSLKLY